MHTGGDMGWEILGWASDISTDFVSAGKADGDAWTNSRETSSAAFVSGISDESSGGIAQCFWVDSSVNNGSLLIDIWDDTSSAVRHASVVFHLSFVGGELMQKAEETVLMVGLVLHRVRCSCLVGGAGVLFVDMSTGDGGLVSFSESSHRPRSQSNASRSV